MRRQVALLGSGLFAVLASTPGCRDAPAAVAPPRAVRAAEAESGTVAHAARFSGTLEPRLRVDLAFRVGGKVALLGTDGPDGRPLQEGDRVRAGQLLAALDERDLGLQVSAAAAATEAAEAQTKAAESGYRQAGIEADRARRLFEASSIARADLDRADSGLASAKAGLEAARAQQRAKREQESIARRALADARLTSPIDGLLARRSIEPGETVGPGAPVASVIDTSEMRLVIGVPDTRINSVRLGQAVTVRIDSLPGRSPEGKVTKIAPTADPALRSYAVEVTVPNGGELRSGMIASTDLEDSGEAKRLRVPLSAVVRNPGAPGFAVYVVDGDRVKARPVEIDDLEGNDVVVSSGLAPGERVVSEGAQLVASGDRIRVVP